MSEQACFLTRALISHPTIEARGIWDAYTWHQLIWQAFPGRDGETRDFLTRLDDKFGAVQVLIVSPREPVRPAWLGSQDEWATKPIPPSYFQARRYRFQLRANVTKKKVEPGPDGRNIRTGKRIALTEPKDILQWLVRKGEQHGFVIPDIDEVILATGQQRFHKTPRQGQAMHGKHGTVDFTGTLEVRDPALFHAAFSRGLGSAKAFGFGLLVLAPTA